MPAFRAKPPKGALLNRADPLARRLVSAYLFNEGGGLTAYDSAGGRRGDGVLTSFAAPPTSTSGWVDSPYGRALSFDGISNRVALATGFTLADFSVFFLSKSTGDSALFGKFGADNPQLRIGQGGANVLSTFDGVNNPVSSVLGVAAGGWALNGFVRKGSTVAFWQNGVPFGTGSMSGALTFDQIGAFLVTANPLSGTMAGVWVWDTAISAKQIYTFAADPFRLFRRRSVVLLKASSAPAGVTATAAITEAADILSAAASVAVSATGTITESADTLTASAAVGIAATASITEAADTLTATGSVAVAATATITEGADTLAASAVVTSGTIATANITEAADTLTASGTVAVAGSASIDERADTLAALATVVVVATAALTEGRDTLSASATVVSGIVATAAITEGVDTLSATAIVSGGGTVPGCVCATIAVANRVSFTLTVSNRVAFTLKTDCCSAA